MTYHGVPYQTCWYIPVQKDPVWIIGLVFKTSVGSRLHVTGRTMGMEGLLHEDIKQQQELFQLTCCFEAIYYFHILCTVLLKNSSDILSTFQELTLVIEVAVLQFMRP